MHDQQHFKNYKLVKHFVIHWRRAQVHDRNICMIGTKNNLVVVTGTVIMTVVNDLQ